MFLVGAGKIGGSCSKKGKGQEEEVGAASFASRPSDGMSLASRLNRPPVRLQSVAGCGGRRYPPTESQSFGILVFQKSHLSAYLVLFRFFSTDLRIRILNVFTGFRLLGVTRLSSAVCEGSNPSIAGILRKGKWGGCSGCEMLDPIDFRVSHLDISSPL